MHGETELMLEIPWAVPWGLGTAWQVVNTQELLGLGGSWWLGEKVRCAGARTQALSPSVSAAALGLCESFCLLLPCAVHKASPFP